MAVTKTIIKLNHLEALVKVVATTPGSATITLSGDLLKSNEELSGESLKVNYGASEVTVQVGTELNITRNGTVICNYFENAEGFIVRSGIDKWGYSCSRQA